MAEDLSAQLNSTPGCIPAKWSRSTIADGDWLQAKTLAPLSSRDNWLANQITNSEIDLETERRERMAADAYLSAVIDPLSSDLYSFSGKVETSAVQITNQIQAEVDRATNRENELEQLITNEKNRAEGKETELQQHINEEKTRAEGAEEALDTRLDNVESDISTLKAATDVIMVYGDYNSFTTNSGDLILTDADVIKVLSDETSDYEQVYYQWYDPASGHEWSGWNDIGSLNPYYSKSEIDSLLTNIETNIETDVAQNYLSNNVHNGRNITATLSESYPKELTIATKDDVDFDSVSASTAYGNSAKFTNISATNISADLFKSDLGTVDTLHLNFGSARGDELTANSVNVINLTAGTLYGQEYNSNVDSLIGSAEYGQFAYNVINSAKFSAVGTTTSTAYISGGFGIKAGNGVGVSLDGKNVVITAEGTTYNAGNYISTASKTISVTGDLIGSAESGQSAYDLITGQSATLSAGPGIGFVSAGPNILGISAEGTKVSAGGNIQDPTEYTTNVNLSAGGGVQFVTADINVLGIKTSTMEYSPYNYSTYSDMTSFKINAVALQGSQYESVVMVNDRVYGFLMPEPTPSEHLKIPVARHDGVRGYYYLDNVTAAIGNYVSASKQQHITLATAASVPSPIDENVYYII